MPKKTEVKVELIRHVDGRTWVRRNMRVICFMSHWPEISELASKVWRQVGGSLTKAAVVLCAAPVIEVSHPQFVRPYEEA